MSEPLRPPASAVWVLSPDRVIISPSGEIQPANCAGCGAPYTVGDSCEWCGRQRGRPAAPPPPRMSIDTVQK
jgi:hypothetical protein